MMALLKDSKGRPMARATLLRKIRQRDKVPPHVSPRRGVYWFPKDLYADWIRKLPATYEVSSAS